MLKIAHRGNYNGRNQPRENTVGYINEALAEDYHVELDVWCIDGQFYLGHDVPGELINVRFLYNPKFWVHAKTFDTYMILSTYAGIHSFWHDADEFVFTSKQIKWANVGVLTNDGIMVMPERSSSAVEAINQKTVRPLGICSDDFSLFTL